MARFQNKKLLFCALIVLFFTLSVSSQSISKEQNGCFYIEKDRPSLYISYEREAIEQNEKDQNNKVVLLRLHNNSTCSIIVDTGGNIPQNETYFKIETNNLPDGVMETKYIPNLSEGARLPIFYDIQESESKSISAANYWEDRDINFTYTIPSGMSSIFSVEASHFQKKFKISVPYSYSWEENNELKTWGTIKHRVFYIYELPKGFYIG